MNGSAIDIVVFAPLAPIFGLVLFWFIQVLFIESQKYLLSKIKSKHEPLCRFTNFLGILFQTICHALGYTVTRSGISSFYISINYGKVAPKKEKKGIFEWFSNTFLFIGPFFIPSLLLLICLFFLIQGLFDFTLKSELYPYIYTFGNQFIVFGTILNEFSQKFFSFLFNIDLFHPGHLVFLILMIFLGMGIRPSYIGETKHEKVDMIYDFKNISNYILKKPIYVLILIVIVYSFFYITLIFNQLWYVLIFSLFGSLSIIAITAIIINHLLLLLIRTTDNLPALWKYLPYVILIISYILMRIIFFFFPSTFTYSISILMMIISTILSILIILKIKTNKFKTQTHMKKPKKIIDDGNDESRRIIKQ